MCFGSVSASEGPFPCTTLKATCARDMLTCVDQLKNHSIQKYCNLLLEDDNNIGISNRKNELESPGADEATGLQRVFSFVLHSGSFWFGERK